MIPAEKYTCVYKETYYNKKLAYTVMDVDKFHDLQWTSYRIVLKFRSSPKRQEKSWCCSWSQKAGKKKNGVPAQQLSDKKFPHLREGSPFFCYSGLQPIRCDPSMLGRATALLSLPLQMLVSFRNNLTDTPGIMFDPITKRPRARCHLHINLSILVSITLSPIFTQCQHLTLPWYIC